MNNYKKTSGLAFLSSIIFIIFIINSSSVQGAWYYEYFPSYTEVDVPNKGVMVHPFYVKYIDWDSNFYGDGALYWWKSIALQGDFEITGEFNLTWRMTSGGNYNEIHRVIYLGNSTNVVRVDCGVFAGVMAWYRVVLTVTPGITRAVGFDQGPEVQHTNGLFYWFKLTRTVNTFVLKTYNSSTNLKNDNFLGSVTLTYAQPIGYNLIRVNRPLTVGQPYRRDGHLRWLSLKGIGYWGFRPDLINMTIIDSMGNIDGRWLFEGEVYDLVAYWNNTNYGYLTFNDGEHDVYFNYFNATDILDVNATDKFVIGLVYSDYTDYVGTNITRTLWRFILDKNIVDSNVTWMYYSENKIGNSTLGITSQDSNIYNLGGYVYYEFNGDGGRIRGGGAFDLRATDGSTNSYARADILFRKVQHFHLLSEIDMSNEWDAVNSVFDIDPGVGYVEYGIDYRLNGTWITGWKCKIYVVDADVGHHAGGNDQDWVEWSIDWYNYDPITKSTQNINTTYLFSNHWGYDHVSGKGYTNRTSSQLWIDLWFNRLNASTTVGGHVNSFYYGLYEQGNPYWFGYGNFRPMKGEIEDSLFIDDLYDEQGNITNCKKFDLIKYWCKVGKVDIADGNDETWRLINREMSRTLATDRMDGIDHPPFEETKILTVQYQGFFARIWSAILKIPERIWNGLLFMFKIIWASMGSFMDWVLPGDLWSRIMNFLNSMVSMVRRILDNLPIIVASFISLFDQAFSFITITIPRYIMFLGMFITSIIAWWNAIVSLFTGGWSSVGDLWNMLSIEQWIILGLNLFPFWWIMFRIIPAKDSLSKMKEDIDMFTDFFTKMSGFFEGFINLIIRFIGFVRGLLPF